MASALLPARVRPHIAAIYAFARTADDFADEPGRSVEERLGLLREWETLLDHTADGRRQTADQTTDAVFLALHDTIQRFDLPVELFHDLLSAFRQDVVTDRYATWAEVMDYCRRSANPVGRLVLRVFGYRQDELDKASDAFCTALQLTNFWQDLAVDWSRGRMYVPEEVWRRHAANPASLADRQLDEAWRSALRDVSGVTRTLFEQGRSVCDAVSGRLRYELRATWLGGTRVLDRLEQTGFDVFNRRPALGVGDALVIAWGTAVWREDRSKKTEERNRSDSR